MPDQKLPNIPGYLNHSSDYVTSLKPHPNLTLGICEIKGNRPRQEDTIVTDISQSTQLLAQLSAQERGQRMEALLACLHQHCGQENDIGSCACIVTSQLKNNQISITTSYVGDSVAFLIILDETLTLKTALPCNPALHDANNLTELAAIHLRAAKNPNIRHQRLNGELAIFRAIGDQRYESFGLSHIPDTTTIQHQVASRDQIYVVVACDGVMEHLKGPNVALDCANELGALLETQIKKGQSSAISLAEAIVANSYQNQSNDNISAIVISLTTGAPSILAGIFDGHGGSSVALAIKEHFLGCLNKVMNP